MSLQDCAAGAFLTPEDDADVVARDTRVRCGGISWQIAGAVAEVSGGHRSDEADLAWAGRR
jgi:hypothetical protein